MDPLGAPSQFVDIDSLPGWTDAYEAKQLDSHQNPVEKAQVGVRSPFPYREDINAKIILWKGDVALLNCTAIVNTSNETLTDKNPVSESIFVHAGPDLKDELQKLKGCRTGEAKLTKGFNLAARFIIHTVGPKYKSRYRTAAESSLYSCYRNVLQLAKEQAMCSVGFCVINSLKRCYPLEDATHIALPSSCLLSTTTQSLDLPAWYSYTIGKLLQLEGVGFPLAVQADWRNLSYPLFSRGADTGETDLSVVFSAICLLSETHENIRLNRFRKLLWNHTDSFVL